MFISHNQTAWQVSAAPPSGVWPVGAGGGVTDHVFVDDAILIEKYYVIDLGLGHGSTPIATIAVSINANPRRNNGHLSHRMNFDVDW